MDHPNQGGDKDEQFPALLGQDGEISVEEFVAQLLVDDVPDSSWDVTGTGQHGAPTGSLDELNSLNFHNPQAWNFGNQSVAGTGQPVLLGQDSEISVEDFISLYPDSLRVVAGTVQHGAPTDSLDELLNFDDHFGNQSVAGTEQPENQMPAEIQPSIQEQLDAAAEKEQKKRNRKKEVDKKHYQKKKQKTQELTNRNQELENANQVKDQLLNALRAEMEVQLQKELQHLVNLAKAVAKIGHLEKEYLLLEKKNLQLEEELKKTSREKNQLRQKMKNSGKLCIEKPKKKLKKQAMIAETAEETETDN